MTMCRSVAFWVLVFFVGGANLVFSASVRHDTMNEGANKKHAYKFNDIIKAKLRCGNQNDSDDFIRLMIHAVPPCPDGGCWMESAKSDKKGDFELIFGAAVNKKTAKNASAEVIEKKSIEIFTDCNAGAKPCERVIPVPIPDHAKKTIKKETGGEDWIFDLGTIDLKKKFVGEHLLCCKWMDGDCKLGIGAVIKDQN